MVTKNCLQGDSSPGPQNLLKPNFNASIYWTTLVNADKVEFKRGIYSFSVVIDSFQG